MPGTPGRPDGPRVLVVDDEPHLADLVALAVRLDGYVTEVANTGFAALKAVDTFRPALIVLDVQLPDVDGFEIQRRLRADGHLIPVVFLTARDSTDDKVRGLTLGGDDYVTKPFSVDELLARIRAVLRRFGAGPDAPSVLRVGDLELDEDGRQVRRNGSAIELTPTEYNLCRYLMVNARRVVSKQQILDHVWDYDYTGDTGLVETYISYLRKKLEFDGSPPLIQTVRGFGYTIRPESG